MCEMLYTHLYYTSEYTKIDGILSTLEKGKVSSQKHSICELTTLNFQEYVFLWKFLVSKVKQSCVKRMKTFHSMISVILFLLHSLIKTSLI